MPIDDNRPIVVEVTNYRWEAFSLSTVPTPRDVFLKSTIDELGGISEDVAPGRYHFNAETLDNNHIVVSLDRI